MEDPECQRNGCKFDLGTGEPLKYLVQKKEGGQSNKNKDLFFIVGFHDCKRVCSLRVWYLVVVSTKRLKSYQMFASKKGYNQQ